MELLLGIGTIKLLIDGHTLLVDNVRYIPELSESIYSLFVHVQSPNHGLQSSFETGRHILFPNFTTTAILGEHDIYLHAFQEINKLSVHHLFPSTHLRQFNVKMLQYVAMLL